MERPQQFSVVHVMKEDDDKSILVIKDENGTDMRIQAWSKAWPGKKFKPGEIIEGFIQKNDRPEFPNNIVPPGFSKPERGGAKPFGAKPPGLEPAQQLRNLAMGHAVNAVGKEMGGKTGKKVDKEDFWIMVKEFEKYIASGVVPETE